MTGTLEGTDELLREWYAVDALPEQQTNEYANAHNLATCNLWQALTGERDAPESRCVLLLAIEEWNKQ